VRNSLSLRIIVSGTIVVTLTLLITATLLVYMFREHIEEHFDALLFDHIEELVAASKLNPDGTFKLNWRPLDPRFHKFNSGWYWEIKQSGKTLDSSRSLESNHLRVLKLQGNSVLTALRKKRLLLSELIEGSLLEVQQFYGPNKKLLRAQLLEITSPSSDLAISYMVTGPVSEIEQDVSHFAKQVIISFLVLGSGLLLAIMIQVRVALKPLNAIRNAIGEVHQGKKKRLPENYPAEIQLVVSEINSLLDHNAETLMRARKNLGNLSHTIKNPLAVIINEANSINSEPGQLIQNKAALIATNLDNYLARARAAGTTNLLGSRTNIVKVVEDLCYCIEHLHKDTHIKINIYDLDNYSFRGEAQDLEEMIGNLIDNAYKWAHDQVWVHAKVDKNNLRLFLFVEDNGPGVPDSHLNNVLQRGRKLDETVSGHGLGLNIVNDITQLYKGSLTLEKSSHGGLCAVLNLPVASN
jgi:signal transduction histidine kinase